MSLIVLNSKGSDPHDFTNYLTEQIKFPRNAEVCLTHSHINRKLLVEKEVEIPAGANTMSFQLGSGAFKVDRNTTAGYTAHSPSFYNFVDKVGIFPLKISGFALIEAAIDGGMNDPDNTIISPLVGGWAADIATVPPFLPSLHCQALIPSDVASDGSSRAEDILFQVGKNTLHDGGTNNTSAVNQDITQGILGYDDWVLCQPGVLPAGRCGNFLDTKPLWNTSNAGRLATFANTASVTNIIGGGYHWQFLANGVVEDIDVLGLRGGILGNKSFSGRNGITSDVDVRTNPLTGGTSFDIWWEVGRYTAATGSVEVNFYSRPIPFDGTAKRNEADPLRQHWGNILIVVANPGERVRVGMRPIQVVVGGIQSYVIEGYGCIVDAANQIVGVVSPAIGGGKRGYVKITDPLATDGGELYLYRHLPIRMGVSQVSGAGVYMNAIHHGDPTKKMALADQTKLGLFTFGMNRPNLIFQQVEKLDPFFYGAVSKSTLGTSLGFTTPIVQTTAALMVGGQPGVVGDIPINATIPMNHSLVVSLPDLSITGYFGNSNGDLKAGTLNMNSGGQSATILGVIPFGSTNTRQPDELDEGLNLSGRGQYWSAGVENWISLNNPAAFSLSAMRVKITDELGTIPNCLEPNSTITIKIRGVGGEQRQGGVASVFHNNNY